jgi:hypothetical protein
MVMKGNVAIRAPRIKGWEFLTEPRQIGQCLSGGERDRNFRSEQELPRHRRLPRVCPGEQVEVLDSHRKRVPAATAHEADFHSIRI